MTTKKNVKPPDTGRLHSLDAYRGLVMFFLAANGFGIAAATKGMGDAAQADGQSWSS